jgi:hypothetical protein
VGRRDIVSPGETVRSRRDTAAWQHEREPSNRTVTLSVVLVTLANVGLMTERVSSDVRLDRLFTLLCRHPSEVSGD